MKSMKKWLASTMGAAMLCASMSTVAMAAPNDFAPGEIQVTGSASRQVAPSYAVLNLGISSESTDVAVAKSKNDAVMSSIIARLGSLGIAKKDIVTSTMEINPITSYDNGKRNRTGYNVTNRVTVRINNLNNVGKVIDGAVKAGATDVNSLSFQNDVTPALSDQLTTEAVKDGRHKAEVIASALGRTLGPVKSVNIYNTSNTPVVSARYYKANAAALDTSTPIEEGTIVINQDASITYYVQ